MKKILGAIAAAMVLGAGCAHNQEKTAQTEAPSSPQASVESGQLGGSGALAGYQCEVISMGGSGAVGSGMTQSQPSASVTTGSSPQQSECPAGEASASTVQGNAPDVSAWGAASPGGAGSLAEESLSSADTSIGGADTQDDATGGSASEDLAIGDSTFQDITVGGVVSQNANTGGSAAEEDLAIGGSAAEEDLAIGGSAAEEDLAIGGAASQNANTGGSASQSDVQQGGAATEEDLAIGGSPSEDAAVEDTGTGSADGGGG